MNCGAQDYIKIGAMFLAYSVFEYWLGKTNKVRQASFIELLIMGAVLVITLMVNKLKGERK